MIGTNLSGMHRDATSFTNKVISDTVSAFEARSQMFPNINSAYTLPVVSDSFKRNCL
jgi:hypothetical protein